MITAADLPKYIELNNSAKSKIVDDWLQTTVFPRWGDNVSGFRIPTGVRISEIEGLLRVRGFLTKAHSGYKGDFVYITLPPQND